MQKIVKLRVYYLFPRSLTNMNIYQTKTNSFSHLLHSILLLLVQEAISDIKEYKVLKRNKN